MCQVVEGVISEKCLLVAPGLLWEIENTHLCVCMYTNTYTHINKQMTNKGRGDVELKEWS